MIQRTVLVYDMAHHNRQQNMPIVSRFIILEDHMSSLVLILKISSKSLIFGGSKLVFKML